MLLGNCCCWTPSMFLEVGKSKRKEKWFRLCSIKTAWNHEFVLNWLSKSNCWNVFRGMCGQRCLEQHKAPAVHKQLVMAGQRATKNISVLGIEHVMFMFLVCVSQSSPQTFNSTCVSIHTFHLTTGRSRSLLGGLTPRQKWLGLIPAEFGLIALITYS